MTQIKIETVGGGGGGSNIPKGKKAEPLQWMCCMIVSAVMVTLTIKWQMWWLVGVSLVFLAAFGGEFAIQHAKWRHEHGEDV